MASISEQLRFISDFRLQKILTNIFTDQIVTPPAVTTSLACPVGGVGLAAGGWDTAANRDLAIATINALRTDVAALRATVALLTNTQA